MFGPEGDGIGVTAAIVRLAERAGVALRVPTGIESLCCGTPWSSKGFAAGHDVMRRRVVERLREATEGGRLPVVSAATSCSEGFAGLLAGIGVEVQDALAFAVAELLPRLDVDPAAKLPSLTLHPTCSSQQMGLDPALGEVGRAVADEVHVPAAWGCCAFAGDRGMLHPELTAAATAPEAAEVAALGATAHASCNRTCEIGMTRATGESYVHVLELLERATRVG
ncbi:MAG TPA: (Fe-S)-binding protein [Nocardioides sp.]